MKTKRKYKKRTGLSIANDDLKFTRHKNVVGSLINFRGLVYAPVNENGVIFLFGKVAADLNMYVETIRPGYPDCVAKRFIGKSKWEDIRIEFELFSSHFDTHKHDPQYCDAIVCWVHDWKDHPKHIEIIELQSIIKELENLVLEEPDKIAELSQHNVGDLFHDKKIRNLYDKLHTQISKIDKAIWRKVGESSITYYSPEKVFAYLRVQKKGLRFTVFTNGRNIPGVELIEYERAGQKWGSLFISTETEIPKVTRSLKSSFRRLVDAIKRGDNTGWYAEKD
jgi:hypothetical protein